jgi:hypothetical protein
MWHQSRCSKISINFEVGHVVFNGIACAGALNPAFGLQGYVTELLFIITALLIDRSLGNLGLRRNNFFDICIEPQQLCRLDLAMVESSRDYERSSGGRKRV